MPAAVFGAGVANGVVAKAARKGVGAGGVAAELGAGAAAFAEPTVFFTGVLEKAATGRAGSTTRGADDGVAAQSTSTTHQFE